MKILHISFECYPLAKVGGLGDVVGSLPKYLNTISCDTSVIIPFYEIDYIQQLEKKEIYNGIVNLGSDLFKFSILKTETTELKYQTFLVDIKGLLDRPNIYSYPDDTERFIAFQLAVLDWISATENKPDLIHCHDHHTGLIPFLISYTDKYKNLKKIPTVFTIHNAEYQGQISYDKLYYLPEFDHKDIGILDWDNCINPLAAAIKCAWKVTTVSPSYMKELQKKANGLETLLSHEKTKCLGVLNGIDHDTWNPEMDNLIIKNYSYNTLASGRKINKNWLCDYFDLHKDKPLFGFIGRLVEEKGADILPESITEILNNTDCTILILGSGNTKTENDLRDLKTKFKGRYNVHIGYNEKLSHIMYAGADFLFMPSRIEPCGLNQMYALRYGLIPIVRSIGGLKDTIIDIKEGGNGICHDEVSKEEIYYSIKRGIDLYNNQKEYEELQKNIMRIDNSWNQSAKQYKELYESLIE